MATRREFFIAGKGYHNSTSTADKRDFFVAGKYYINEETESAVVGVPGAVYWNHYYKMRKA